MSVIVSGVATIFASVMPKRLIRPEPYFMSFPASPRSVAVYSKSAFICSGVICGFAWIRSAAAPETCGVAIDVPLKEAYLFSGKEDIILMPGAATSGFIPTSSITSPPEKHAYSLSSFTAPTVRA